ncbi:MAG: ATP-binding protein [Eubacteriales bacterium]|nr:ATP-binding protein [Eubacteriales bacterium]
MKQIVFISGKGGTGKSTLVASLGHLVQNKMLADCDVDAPNLHLLLDGQELYRADYSGGKKAFIDPEACISCGRCREVCRFNAISPDFVVSSMACEGCAACTVVCPVDAITLNDAQTGQTFVHETALGRFAHARLAIGADGSGKLVTQVRRNLSEFQQSEEYVLIDGSPGIGCSVISSITGTDAVVAVSEPTPTGRHDLDRVLSTADHFKVPAYVCINKFDLNPAVSAQIESDCQARNIAVIGKIPFEPLVVDALQHGQTPVQARIQTVIEPIETLWQNLTAALSRQRG